ncbi:MAG: hypothetical protein NTZ12_01565, partial [Candidatus Aminicenantes bacterium]|nr:hypothetical protein [Candidatus Aminicenantes bacterium]
NAGIIYSTFRHGTIHTISPKKIKISGTTFLWLIGKNCDILYQNDLSMFVLSMACGERRRGGFFYGDETG